MAPHVPRVVHQLWMQGADVVPSKYDGARASWRALHPSWDIKTWDERSIEGVITAVAADFGVAPSAAVAWYRAIPTLIQRCDVGRCFVLYAHGGVYADMDTLALQPLDTLLADSEASAARRGSDTHCFIYCRTINNAVFAATPRHPIFVSRWWPEVADALGGGRRKMGWLGRTLSRVGPGFNVVVTTGPLMWGRILAQAAPPAWGVVRPPHHVFYPRSDDSGRLDSLSPAVRAAMAARGSYTYHAQGQSWLPEACLERAALSLTHADTRRTVLVSLVSLIFVAALLAAVAFTLVPSPAPLPPLQSVPAVPVRAPLSAPAVPVVPLSAPAPAIT